MVMEEAIHYVITNIRDQRMALLLADKEVLHYNVFYRGIAYGCTHFHLDNWIEHQVETYMAAKTEYLIGEKTEEVYILTENLAHDILGICRLAIDKALYAYFIYTRIQPDNVMGRQSIKFVFGFKGTRIAFNPFEEDALDLYYRWQEEHKCKQS